MIRDKLPNLGKRLGWVPDVPDARDQFYKYNRLSLSMFLPASVDLRGKMPPVYDQGDLGSCTANASAAAFVYQDMVQGNPCWIPSRLFLYYNTRVIEGTVGEDSGGMLRDSMKSLVADGLTCEKYWNYNIDDFAVKPPPVAYQDAQKHQTLRYQRVQAKVDAMRQVLANGDPFVFGAALYDSFESMALATSGKVQMPGSSESMIGGHAMLCVGYDHNFKIFIVRNSWGTEWGDQGYCYFPYDYLASPNFCDDRWAITKVETSPFDAR